MNASNAFVQQLSTAQRIEFALRDQQIGINQPNRYSQSTMEEESLIDGGRWIFGDQVIAGNVGWNSAQNGGLQIGSNIEDVTGSAHGICIGNREYRSGIQRIILSFSDEQGSNNTQANNVVGALTSPTTGQIFIGASGAILTISRTRQQTNPNLEPFGFVYTTQTTGVAIYRNTVTNDVSTSTYQLADTSWETTELGGAGTGVTMDVNGPIILGRGGSLGNNYQAANTARLAYLTGGAVYDVNKMITSESLDAFGISIGTVLGSLLYDLLS